MVNSILVDFWGVWVFLFLFIVFFCVCVLFFLVCLHFVFIYIFWYKRTVPDLRESSHLARSVSPAARTTLHMKICFMLCYAKRSDLILPSSLYGCHFKLAEILIYMYDNVKILFNNFILNTTTCRIKNLIILKRVSKCVQQKVDQ